MLHKVVDLPTVHWLEQVASFDLVNMKGSHFDMPIVTTGILLGNSIPV
ncbi:hypothetical protein Lser_V15G04371 [Lactuca serriola]